MNDELRPPAPRPPTRVLLVDDSQDDAVTMAFELGRGMKGIETRWAEGGEQMFAAIEEWQPDIVLTDVHMPRFDVFEALARLRQRWPLLPVVVVSGLVGEEAAVRLIKAGANDFVAKAGVGRLPLVVERELRDARERAERASLEARLRSQERLFTRVLEHLPVGVWTVDATGTVRHVNPAARALWEGAPFVDIDGFASFKGWWADSGRPIEPDEWGAVRALRDDETSLGERVEIQTFGGHRRVVLASAVPLRDDDGSSLGCFVVHQDITELHRGEQRLRRTEQMLRALSQRLLDVQEQERRWIAQELHDDIGQGIAAMRFQLSHIVERSHEPAARQLATDALRSSEQLNDRLRQICLGLRPLELDDFGLMAALRSVVASIGERPALSLRLDCEGEELRYAPALETAAFRICQEAISNAMRHSGCTLLQVQVTMSPERLAVSVRDDGCGFEPDPASAAESRARHLGLAGMEERARSVNGRLRIASRAGAGTRVEVEFDTDAAASACRDAGDGSAGATIPGRFA